MAEVVGGNTKSMGGRLAELAAWFPALSALTIVSGASFLDANHMMPQGLPDWVHSGLEAYRGLRDQLMQTAIGKIVPANFADLAMGGIGMVTMISRRILSFAFSIGGFIVLLIAAWFVLKKFA
jgi:hypothetical protein